MLVLSLYFDNPLFMNKLLLLQVIFILKLVLVLPDDGLICFYHQIILIFGFLQLITHHHDFILEIIDSFLLFLTFSLNPYSPIILPLPTLSSSFPLVFKLFNFHIKLLFQTLANLTNLSSQLLVLKL